LRTYASPRVPPQCGRLWFLAPDPPASTSLPLAKPTDNYSILFSGVKISICGVQAIAAHWFRRGTHLRFVPPCVAGGARAVPEPAEATGRSRAGHPGLPRRTEAGGCREIEQESGSVGGPGKRFAVTQCCTEGQQRRVLPVAVQHTGSATVAATRQPAGCEDSRSRRRLQHLAATSTNNPTLTTLLTLAYYVQPETAHP
jgi:hypothetical protein